MGYGIKIFVPRPLHDVTRSPDQGSLFQRLREAEKRDPGNEVATSYTYGSSQPPTPRPKVDYMCPYTASYCIIVTVKMATVDELKNGKFLFGSSSASPFLSSCFVFFLPFNFSFALVLKETLENRGVLGQIRARVRAEVFGALDDQVRKWDYCRSLFDLRFI